MRQYLQRRATKSILVDLVTMTFDINQAERSKIEGFPLKWAMQHCLRSHASLTYSGGCYRPSRTGVSITDNTVG